MSMKACLGRRCHQNHRKLADRITQQHAKLGRKHAWAERSAEALQPLCLSSLFSYRLLTWGLCLGKLWQLQPRKHVLFVSFLCCYMLLFFDVFPFLSLGGFSCSFHRICYFLLFRRYWCSCVLFYCFLLCHFLLWKLYWLQIVRYRPIYGLKKKTNPWIKNYTLLKTLLEKIGG